MRIYRATDSATKETNPANGLSLAPWMHGGPLDHSNPGVKGDGILVLDYSIPNEPKSAGVKEAFNQYKDRLSADILSGRLLRDVVAKLQGIAWGDVPNPQGTLVRVLLPEGVTLPDAIDSEKVRGLPSWIRGEIQFKTEPFKQPSAAQQVLFEKLSPPKSPNNSVPAD
jgi:hypothetical protein